MGSLFKPSQTKSTATNTPWGPQGDALQYGFDQLQNVVGSKLGTPYYQGDLYAPMDPLTSQGIQANADYATGAGAQAAGAVSGAAEGMLPFGQSAGGAYDALTGMASTDPTQANIASAGAYADSPYMNGMIDAASRDVTRNLYENEIPGINMAATGSGNMNSTRAGVAQGIAQRGAQDQIGDIAAQLRGQAYSEGLGVAENARQASMGALGAVGSGYGGLFDLGLKGANLGQDMTYTNNGALISGGQLNQQDQQNALNAAFQQWQGQDQRDLGFLLPYMQAVSGAGNYGTTTSSVPGPSPFQTILGTAATGVGAFLGAGGKFSDPALKQDVQYVGESLGMPVYSYKYRQDMGLELPKGTQVGFMATDVAKKFPEAVSVDRGYLKVDYGKLR